MHRIDLTLVAVLIALIGAVSGNAEVAASDASRPIDFDNDVVPVFTMVGCNAGACHGAAIGRGGFKLSLYGGDPQADYDQIVRRMSGRRVNLANPEDSLVLLKPTGVVDHGGKMLFGAHDHAAQILRAWIAQGARRATLRKLERVVVSPQAVTIHVGEPVELTAVAHYSDGTHRDVTRWTVFRAEDSSAVTVESSLAREQTPSRSPRSLSPEGERAGVRGQSSVRRPTAEVVRRGRHIVVARYLTEVVPIELIAPMTDAHVDLADEPRSNFVDEEILKSLEALGLRPSPLIDDAAFLRRVSLDLTGRLPSVEQAKAFPPHPGPLPREARGRGGRSNREALVDELLESDAFTEYWTLQLAKLLRIRPQGEDGEGAYVYHEWLAGQIDADVSYQQLARTLILAEGDSHEYGPANFYRTGGGAREQAEFVSELFMGARLRCANCHNHPLDRWTQDDYHGLAAIFAKVEGGQVVQPNPGGKVIHPRTLEPAATRIPGESFLGDDATNEREKLADWLTDDDNPYFTKAIVNRLWKHMMGRGLVEPVDDFRATNPATHPALLDKLAEDFAAHGYSLRHTLRVIATSAAYARSDDATEANKDDDQFYSHAHTQPLEPEVLVDAISDVLGVADIYGDQPQGTRAVALVDPRTPSQALDILGRCDREASCESSPGAVGGLRQKLHLLNGRLVNARIVAEGSRLSRLLAEGKPPVEIVSEFYLAALSRRPSDEEAEYWGGHLASLNSPEDRRAFLEDFVWGVVTCREFVVN